MYYDKEKAEALLNEAMSPRANNQLVRPKPSNSTPPDRLDWSEVGRNVQRQTEAMNAMGGMAQYIPEATSDPSDITVAGRVINNVHNINDRTYVGLREVVYALEDKCHDSNEALPEEEQRVVWDEESRTATIRVMNRQTEELTSKEFYLGDASEESGFLVRDDRLIVDEDWLAKILSLTGEESLDICDEDGNPYTIDCEGVCECYDAPYEDAPYEDAPYEDAPYEDDPYEDVPYEDAPYEDAPYEDAPYEDTPYEDTPYEDTPISSPGNYDAPYEDTAISPPGNYDDPYDGATDPNGDPEVRYGTPPTGLRRVFNRVLDVRDRFHNFQDNTRNIVRDVQDRGRNMFRDIQDRGRNLRRNIQDAPRNLFRNIIDAPRNIRRNIQDGIRDRVRNRVDRILPDSIRGGVDRVRNIVDRGRDIRRNIQDAPRNLLRNIIDAPRNIRRNMQDNRRDRRRTRQDNRRDRRRTRQDNRRTGTRLITGAALTLLGLGVAGVSTGISALSGIVGSGISALSGIIGGGGISASILGGGMVPEPQASPGPPQWLRDLWNRGNRFNAERRPFYDYNEVRVWDTIVPDGGTEVKARGRDGNYFVVDSYIPGKEIVFRRLTQFSEILETTAKGYLNEFVRKYPVGAEIADLPFNPSELIGKFLEGDLIFEVPVQNNPIPQSIIDAATEKNIIIRNVEGTIYNP